MSKNPVLLLFLVLAWIATLEAQDKKPYKKVIIIEKTDINGNVSESRTEAEGDEADELLRTFNAEENHSVDADTKGDVGHKTITISKISSETHVTDDNEMNINVPKDRIDGKIEKYKIVKKEGNTERVIEWDGNGEMPAELAQEMKNIKINKKIDGDNMTISIDAKDLKGDQDAVIQHETPSTKRQKMVWKDDKDQIYFPQKGQRKFESPDSKTNRASLGVMIDDTDHGVVITDLVNGSAAEKSRLRRGDTILKINDTYIFTTAGLLEALKPYNPNEKVKIGYLRGGKEKSTKAVLNARK